MESYFDFYCTVFQNRDNILVSGYSNGEKVFKYLPYEPFLYRETNKNTGVKSIYGQNLERICFNNISHFYSFLRQNNDISNMKFYGTESLKMQWISENFDDDIKADFSKFRKVFIDIETCCELGFPEPSLAPEPINAITYYDSILKKYYVLTDKEHGTINLDDEECILIQCENEKELLFKFVSIWTSNYPDVLSGWNTNMFDIPYIINRIYKILGENYVKKLSPFGIVGERKIRTNRGEQQCYDIIGVSDLDYLELYKKFSYGEKPSYSLKYITTLELGETKLDHEEFASMHLFYKENYQKFIEYNIQDVKLITKLDERLKYIKLAIQIAYIAKINFRECFSPVITWESLIYNYLKKQNLYCESTKKEHAGGEYMGAFVKQPVPNVYKWIVSFDLNSLYPSLIRQFNISPEKIYSEPERNVFLSDIKKIDEDTYKKLLNPDLAMESIINKEINNSYFKENNISLSGSGYMFKKDSKGFLPSIMEHVYNQRKSIKKEMLMHESNVEKLKAEIHKRGLII